MSIRILNNNDVSPDVVAQKIVAVEELTVVGGEDASEYGYGYGHGYGAGQVGTTIDGEGIRTDGKLVLDDSNDPQYVRIGGPGSSAGKFLKIEAYDDGLGAGPVLTTTEVAVID